MQLHIVFPPAALKRERQGVAIVIIPATVLKASTIGSEGVVVGVIAKNLIKLIYSPSRTDGGRRGIAIAVQAHDSHLTGSERLIATHQSAAHWLIVKPARG